MNNIGWESLVFEERQRRWDGSFRRQFRQHHGRQDRPNVWECWVQAERIFVSYGLLGGARQETTQVGKEKNSGKANLITAAQDAMATARRMCRKKYSFEGYDEYVGELNCDRRFEDISIQHLLTNLPESFCLYKPDNNLFDCKGLLEKTRERKVFYTLKRDGLAHWIVKDFYGNITIYSRRSRRWNDKEAPKELADGTLDESAAIPWAARFPHLVRAVQELPIPNGTMLACELVVSDTNGRDNFKNASSYTKSLTPQALEDMQAGIYPQFYWWDIPFLGGEDLVSKSRVRDRYSIIASTMRDASPYSRQWILPITVYDGQDFESPEQAIDWAKKHGIEGFVIVDPNGVYEDKGWSLKGKPDRPGRFCAKLKPKYEDDFVLLWEPEKKWGTWGKGRHEFDKPVKLPDGRTVKHGGIGSVGLFQYNTAGELIYICDCSSGMDYEFQAQLHKSHFPFVAQIEYTERTYISDGDDTNALKFPVFLRTREDKKTGECINARL